MVFADLCEFSLRFLREPNPFFSRKDRKGLRKGREKDQWVGDPRRGRDQRVNGSTGQQVNRLKIPSETGINNSKIRDRSLRFFAKSSLRFLREPNPFFSRKDRKGLRKGREKDQWGPGDQRTRRPGDGYCSLLIAQCSLLKACSSGFGFFSLLRFSLLRHLYPPANLKKRIIPFLFGLCFLRSTDYLRDLCNDDHIVLAVFLCTFRAGSVPEVHFLNGKSL